MDIDSHIKEWQNFNNLEHKVIDAFLEEYFKSKKEVEKDFIAIGFRVIIDVINAIHFYKKKNYTSQINPIPFKTIISYTNEFNKHNLKYRIILFIKVFLNINRFRSKSFFLTPKFVAQESFNFGHLKKYTDGGILYPFSIYSEIIKSRKKKINYDDSFIKILSNKIFENIKKNIKNIDYQLDTNVSLIIENHFKEFSRDYFNLKAKRNLKSFIFSTGNKTAFRLYARLSLNKNNKIEAFAHGHNLQNKDKHKLWMDLLISNTYYEQSESLRNELKQYIESLPEYQNLHKINFNFVNKFNTSNYSNIVVDLNKINKVLVIGNATKSHAFSSVTAFEIDTQIAIEESIFNYFKKLDKEVYYKPHPGGHLKKELLKHYAELEFLKIENDNFEEILSNYDLIVFYYTRTSTITAALNSNKPILLFDLGIEEHCSVSRKLLEERCFIENTKSL